MRGTEMNELTDLEVTESTEQQIQAPVARTTVKEDRNKLRQAADPVKKGGAWSFAGPLIGRRPSSQERTTQRISCRSPPEGLCLSFRVSEALESRCWIAQRWPVA